VFFWLTIVIISMVNLIAIYSGGNLELYVAGFGTGLTSSLWGCEMAWKKGLIFREIKKEESD
jgi:hypothetical protein